LLFNYTDTGGRKLKKPQLEQIEQFLDGKELHTTGLSPHMLYDNGIYYTYSSLFICTREHENTHIEYALS